MKADRFVVVQENEDGAHWLMAVTDSAAEAWGTVMMDVWDFSQSYKDEGDVFEIGIPFRMDGDGGYALVVRYKAACWTHLDQPKTQRYYVLFDYKDGEKENG